MGGMFGESKFEVLEKVPDDCKPKTIFVKLPVNTDEVLALMRKSGLVFPVIFKPDLGERGWMVNKINQADGINAYLNQIKTDFLIQEFVDLPFEFGVFYIRYPNEGSGKVISVAGKEMLAIRGDGVKSVKELILETERAKLQWETLQITYRHRLEEILPKDHSLELVSIGNHCLGTRFINDNHLITRKMSDSFDLLSRKISGFYFGRYDLRVASLEDLENAKIKVVELNGCGAEPAHIYDPQFSLREAMKILVRHWTYIYQISAENHAQGVPYISFREGKAIYKKFKSLTP
jgi:hypothetical protein